MLFDVVDTRSRARTIAQPLLVKHCLKGTGIQ